MQEDIIVLRCKMRGFQAIECQKDLQSELSSVRTVASIRSRLAALRGHYQDIYNSETQTWQSLPLQSAIQELEETVSRTIANDDSNTASA